MLELKDFFHLPQVYDLLAEAPAARETEPLCQAILTDLVHFQGEGEQFDDMTLLVAAVKEEEA